MCVNRSCCYYFFGGGGGRASVGSGPPMRNTVCFLLLLSRISRMARRRANESFQSMGKKFSERYNAFFIFLFRHTQTKKKTGGNQTQSHVRFHTHSLSHTHSYTHSLIHSLTHSLTHMDTYTLALPSVYVELDSWMTVRIGCSSLWARRSFNLALQVTNTAARLPSLLQVFGTGETYSVPPPQT